MAPGLAGEGGAMRRWLPAVLLVLVIVATGAAAYRLGFVIGNEQKQIVHVERYEEVQCNCSPAQRTSGPNGLYLDVMKLSLTDLLYETDPRLRAAISTGHYLLGRGLTGIGMRRLDNIQELMQRSLRDGIPGDFIEAGAWKGGACIFMRAVLEAHGVADRSVWVADSFEGLPLPQLPPERRMIAPLEMVQDNFRRYGLLDGQVKFLKGWFKDTLPKAPISRLAVLRVDADLYESTLQALEYLYPKVSRGGYVIVDDYGYFAGCSKAVDDFRARQKITTPLVKIDWTGVYWQKEPAPGSSQLASSSGR
jgi:O-methyltransferase